MGAVKPRTVAQAADFAARLKSAMGDDYSPTDLAKICGISRVAASKWLTGGGISPVHLFRISRYLNVNPEWLGAGIGKRERSAQCVHDDIPERDIDLIRAIGRIPADVQQKIRSLVDSLIPGQ
jgi:transcriptional regulator with XRE-family HTH domain